MRWVRAAVFVPAVLAMTGLAVAMTGCASPARSTPAHPAAPEAGRPGIPAQALRVACPSASSTAGRQAAALPAEAVPEGFVPAAVVLCTLAIVPVNGGMSTAPVRKIAVTGLGRLVAALRAPTPGLPPGTACAAQLIALPWFVLVGENGQVILPKIPLDPCGEPSAAVMQSLDALHWVTA